jgi:hypothetical protein
MVSFGYKCGTRKLLFGIPALIAIALIVAISYVFLHEFLPYSYHHEYTTERYVIEIIFYYLSIMTVVCICLTAVSDPGYLSLEYQHPLTHEGYAPLNQLRAHNMRLFSKHKLYDFTRDNVMGGDYEEQPFISLDDSAVDIELSNISTHTLTE